MNKSTLVPREEMSDLDWLARNVHKWPTGGHQPWCYVYQKAGKRQVSGNCITVVSPCVKIDKAQWLARRAELQNKPSWKKDAPDWAEWLAQDEDGEWKWLAGLPGKYVDGWTAVKIKSHCKGITLGDWRDTLERRPEELKQFTSIEDNQEQDMTQQQEMKRDNGWFERGELPPVGTVCEYTLGADAPWHQCEIKYVIRGNGVVMKRIPYGNEQYCALLHRNPVSFRPIRTEREMLADLIESHGQMSSLIVADAILAAGFSLGAK